MSNCPTNHDNFKNYFVNLYIMSSECTALFKKFDCYGLLTVTNIKSQIYRDFKTTSTIPEFSSSLD